MIESANTRKGMPTWGWVAIIVGVAAAIALFSVLTNAANGAFDDEPETGVTVTYDDLDISPECMTAMDAADGAEGEAALLSTLDACSSAGEWVDALKVHPGVGSLVSYTTSDAEELLEQLCKQRPDGAVCAG